MDRNRQVKEDLLKEVRAAIEAEKKGCSKQEEIWHLERVLRGLRLFIRIEKEK